MKLLITDIFSCHDKAKVRNDVILKNGYDLSNYFTTFEKFLHRGIIIPSFIIVGSQMLELDQGAFLPPPPNMK